MKHCYKKKQLLRNVRKHIDLRMKSKIFVVDQPGTVNFGEAEESWEEEQAGEEGPSSLLVTDNFLQEATVTQSSSNDNSSISTVQAQSLESVGTPLHPPLHLPHLPSHWSAGEGGLVIKYRREDGE